MILKSIIGAIMLFLSTSSNAALVAVDTNTAGYPINTQRHGATAESYVFPQDIDAICYAENSDYVINGSTSASAHAVSCGFGAADSTLNFSSSSTTLLASGVASISVEGTSTPPESSGLAIAQFYMNVNFEVDAPSNYEISALFVDGGQIEGISSIYPRLIPASVWLFGSGLIGLIGVMSRRDRSHEGLHDYALNFLIIK